MDGLVKEWREEKRKKGRMTRRRGLGSDLLPPHPSPIPYHTTSNRRASPGGVSQRSDGTLW